MSDYYINILVTNYNYVDRHLGMTIFMTLCDFDKEWQ